MTASLRMEGANQLADLGRDLKNADKQLRRDMLSGIRKITRPAIAAVRISAETRLPRRGGLAHEVASSRISSRTSLTGRSAGVRITRPVGAGLDRTGKLRHKVYGNPEVWVEQQTDAEGWFSRPLEQLEPTVQRAMQRVLDDTARKIARGGTHG